MPWWPRSKDSKKGQKPTAGLFDGGRPRGPRPRAEDDGSSKNSRYSLDLVSDAGSGSGKGSRSPSPSSPSNDNNNSTNNSINNNNNSSRGGSGGGGGGRHSRGQPLPLPCAPPMKLMERTYSASQLPNSQSLCAPAVLLHHAPSMPLPSPTQPGRMEPAGSAEVDYPSGSVSSVSSLGSADVDPRQPARVSNLRPTTTQEPEPLDQLRGPAAASQLGQGSLAAPRGRVLRPPHESASSRLTSPLPGSHPHPAAVVTSPTMPSRVWAPIWQGEGMYPAPLKIPQPDSSMSSPAPSPRTFQQAQRSSIMQEPPVVASGSASPHSGNTSTHNSWQGDGAPLWPPQQYNDERSPSPSPRLRSPGPSRTTSATVSPLHPRAGGRAATAGGGGPDSPTAWPDESGQGRSPYSPKPLPLPPLPMGNTNTNNNSNNSPYSSPPVTSGPSTPTMLSRHPSSNTMERYRAVELPVPAGTPTKWQKGKLLGSGTFGNVYVGFNNDNGGFCAMKEVLLVSDDHKSKESVKQLGQEISLLSKLRHENIVQYIGTETLEDRLYIYLEYVSGGSIHKLLQEYGAFKEPVVRNYTRQILSGLAYLHYKNTVHRDIKGANILVDTNGMVKLADFGMAKHISGQSFLKSFKGSPYWMAPEVIKHTGGYDLAVDIWSLGCTVLEMVTTKPPWHQYEGIAAMFKIGNSKELPAIPDSLSREGKEFVRLCLQRDPAHRPMAAQLLEHPFVQDCPRICRPDDTLAGADLLLSTTPAIRPVNVGSNMGHRPPTSHENEGGYSTQARGRPSHSPSDLSPRCQSRPVHQSQPRPVHQVYSGMSTPMLSSGSSTPPTGGGYGCSPLLPNQVSGAFSMYPNEAYANNNPNNPNNNNNNNSSSNNNNNNSSRTQSGRYASPSMMNGGGGGGVYLEPPRKDFNWSTTPPQQRTPEGSPRRKAANVDNNILDYALGRMEIQGNGGNFGEHLSHQLQHHHHHHNNHHHNNHHHNHPQHHRPGSNHQSPLLSRTNSHEFGRQW